MTITPRALTAGATILAASGLLSACSTADGLLAHGGGNLGILASTATDVVLQNGITIQSAPVCETEEQSEVTYTCTGRTIKGKAIKVAVSGAGSEADVATGNMVVLIGSEQIFSGSVQEVLDQRMLATN